jgi:hypothetical protein
MAITTYGARFLAACGCAWNHASGSKSVNLLVAVGAGGHFRGESQPVQRLRDGARFATDEVDLKWARPKRSTEVWNMPFC